VVVGVSIEPRAGRAQAARAAPARLQPVVPADFDPNGGQSAAVGFAWQSFVALNWPAAARGVPDRTKVIGQPGPLVWDTWKSPEEVFYADGRRPPPWDQYGEPLPPECGVTAATAGIPLLRRIAKAPRNTHNKGVRQVREAEAVGGTLTDQHGNLAHFDIRLNRNIFESIVRNGWYSAKGQANVAYISFPAGVMEVKAAWREMTVQDSAEVRRRFYIKRAWLYTPPIGRMRATCVMADVGLVGLHITHKTPSRAQWTWATFEHVDNVPPAAPGWNGPFSFNNPTASCPPPCEPNKSTEKNHVPTGIPTQVTRLTPIAPEAAAANAQWQAALASVVPGSAFQFYQLVDIQWPQAPAHKPIGDPKPNRLRNTVMETYVKESTCIGCHYGAQTAAGQCFSRLTPGGQCSSDYSFVLGDAR
jgi:hypothetical protein